MCGIAALSGRVDDDLLEAIGASLRHRGPDGGGVFRGEGGTLVARRLAILDLPGGEQPMVSDDGVHVNPGDAGTVLNWLLDHLPRSKSP